MTHTAASLQAMLLANTALADANRGNRDVREVTRAEASRLVPRFPADHVPPPAPGPARPSDAENARTPEPWLVRLMECGGWTGRRLTREEQLSAAVARELRILTRSGRLRGVVWSAHRVELPIRGKIGAMLQALLRFLGVIVGSSDYVFTWATGSGWIELKCEAGQGDMLGAGQRKTYLRPIQRDFREWCVNSGVKHAVVRAIPELHQTLRDWGRL